jgi:glycosyltransferase involved in cell wall biosynthesis
MNNAPRASLLHLTDTNRGGSQRHIVDLVRSAGSVFRPYIVRASAEAVDVTDVDGLRVLPLDPRRLAGGLSTVVGALRRTLGVGGLHAHALAPLIALAEAPERPLAGLPYVVTLHDVRAIDPDCFARSTAGVAPDAGWIARCAPILRDAARVIGPSEWLRDIVRDAYAGIDPQVVANGIDAAAAPATAAVRSPLPAAARTYAIVGAIGEHKGRQTLADVAARIADSDIVGVVIGYTDTRDEPGWLVPGKLYLHGRYQPAELPALLAAYGCRFAYFPNIVPESFSYVLSEVWQAGLPALVPEVGALGARMHAVQGGWLLADPLEPAAAARQIATLLAPAGDGEVAAARARLAAAAGAVPSVAAMRAGIDDIHRSVFPTPAADPESGWLQLGASLHAGREPGLDESLLDAQWPALAREERALREWTGKLGADVAALEASTRRLHAQFELSVLRNRTLAADINALKSRNALVEADAAALQGRAERSDEALAVVTERNRTLERDFAEIARRNAELEQHVIALRERNIRVEADVGALITRNLQLEGNVVALTGRNIELQTDIAGLKERNTLVEAGLAAIGQRNIRVENDAALLQSELAAAQARLSELERVRARTARIEQAIAYLPRPVKNWLLPDA